MKKSLLCLSLLLITFAVTGCKPMIFDWDWMVKPDNQIYCENRWWDYIEHNNEDWWNGAEWCRSSISEIFCPIEDIKSRECWPWLEMDFVNDAFDYCKENWW
jgi:hypothetical protein